MAFRAVLFILAFLLSVHSEVEAKSKKANSTAVLCVFRKMEKCYNIMPAMGGNMSLRFAHSPAELSGNCMQLEPFKTCLKNPCGQKVNLDKTLADISTLATNLCDLGKLGGSFINASRDCYNQNFTEIQKCIARYDTKEKNDIKALCKSNKETVKCVKNVIGRCKNGTAILKNVITTFNSYAPLLCGAYGLHPTSLWILAMLQLEPFKTCLKTPCGQKVNLDKTLADISNLATNLCDLGKLGGSFINASRDCYNQNFTEIQKCIARYDTKEKNDTKALCKSNKETVKCVKNVIGRCKNGTAILKNVITTFNSYAPLLCGAYGLHPTSLWILAMLYIIVASFALH